MLFCITANFTPKAMNAIRENPKSNQHDAVEQLVKAAGGKLVGMYGTMANGPGALVIVDVDPVAASGNKRYPGVIRWPSEHQDDASILSG